MRKVMGDQEAVIRQALSVELGDIARYLSYPCSPNERDDLYEEQFTRHTIVTANLEGNTYEAPNIASWGEKDQQGYQHMINLLFPLLNKLICDVIVEVRQSACTAALKVAHLLTEEVDLPLISLSFSGICLHDQLT